ncbi:MAG: ABC transporter permease [Spirochaetia bacterium]|nr:ABC transporter permease [Spirochaetia bacterium]
MKKTLLSHLIRYISKPYRLWKYIGGIFALIVFSSLAYLTIIRGKKIVNKILTDQIFFTGNLAIKIISSVAFLIGAITVIQLFERLSQLGALDLIAVILDSVIVRELGPLLAGFVVIARSGSAIAAEIATMMVNEEISALEMLGIDTLYFIVFPRIAGACISLMVLTIYFIAMGLLGGFFIGNLYAGITFADFQTYITREITFVDVVGAVLKSAVFGVFISTISIYYGFQAFSSTQIPQVTTKSVVSSIFVLFIIDIIMTLSFSL